MIIMITTMLVLTCIVRYQDAQLRLRLLERESNLMKVWLTCDVWRMTCDS